MTTTEYNPKDRKLRPRKKVIIPPPVSGNRTISRPRTGDTFVKSMDITIDYVGHSLNKHHLDFTEDPLTLKEMYNRGFLGELDLLRKDGSVIEAELEAGPVGQFNGQVLGRFVFKVFDPQTGRQHNVRILKFSFKKA